ncbi:prepilin-type N-terminal cleavage/methylation domain-containing protein [Acidithiobacillus ferrooxidans]|jgi:type IV pilus assembly protein PilW|uniref:PilW family protein n=1 Tax=Acidithiobacillus ferrooxidans TaxID=920 RepID=UPI001C0773D2|nr:PilW family protein [Acidithiobacillus ferrooxidans]MBU2860203.1 prepilin-type N-terminal cleavage/methylation domain-containing protein [Acidithiobacillus ferrooxidans]
MNRLSSSRPTNVRYHENGLTLVELLVSLVVVGLLATAVFSFFLTTSQSVSQQSASGEMWQRGRNALAIMRQAIESAGYGLPSYSQCPNGVVGINNATGTPGALVAITASAQASGSSYYPDTASGINTYSFSTVIGGGSFGGAPATTVNSAQGANITVVNTEPLNPGDLALLAPQGGGTCLLGQITNVAGKGTLNSSCQVTGGGNAQGAGTVVFNSGKGKTACFQANPNQLFSLVTGTGNTSLTGASLYDLGSQDFLFETFEIKENPAGSTPTLYMTQYTGAQASTPTPQALASGVVDMQIQYGLGTNGAVQTWVTPKNYTPSATQNIVAVQLAMLIRSSRYLPNSLSPASFSIMGKTYTVPTTNGPGCLQGDCQHYEYHLFQSVIPVRNGIWQGD